MLDTKCQENGGKTFWVSNLALSLNTPASKTAHAAKPKIECMQQIRRVLNSVQLSIAILLHPASESRNFLMYVV